MEQDIFTLWWEKVRQIPDLYSASLQCAITLALPIFSAIFSTSTCHSFLARSIHWRLRKIGQYAHGIRKVCNGIKRCHLPISNIQVTMILSAAPQDVDMHVDWYHFIQERASITVLGATVSTSKAKLESDTRLRNYKSRVVNVPVHAEFTLALHRFSNGHRTGDIGISKNSCICWAEGLGALNKRDYEYAVSASHRKAYVSRLTGNGNVDRDVVELIAREFDVWMCSLHSLPDSDASDHLRMNRRSWVLRKSRNSE